MLLLIDKPKGMTSHDVVDIVRKKTGTRRVGHAGTLDPNATGLLIVGVGRESTKKLGEIALNTKKVYEAEIFLGESRDTDDIEGAVLKRSDVKNISKEKLLKTMKSFLGKQLQTPPQYSAIKLQGKKAYEIARDGMTANLKKREVTIYKADLVSYNFPVAVISFEVSSGTYIRSIARDLGEKLKTYAYLANLRRTKIGEFRIEDAQRLDTLLEEK